MPVECLLVFEVLALSLVALLLGCPPHAGFPTSSRYTGGHEYLPYTCSTCPRLKLGVRAVHWQH